MKNDDALKAFGCAGIIIYAIGMIILSPIIDGWVLTILWKWFIVDIFNVTVLTLPYAIGIRLTLRFIITQHKDITEEKKSEKSIIQHVKSTTIAVLLPPLVALFIGWIITWFI